MIINKLMVALALQVCFWYFDIETSKRNATKDFAMRSAEFVHVKKTLQLRRNRRKLYLTLWVWIYLPLFWRLSARN